MSLLRRFTNLFTRSRVEREIDAELRAHIDLRTADNIASGMPPAAARRDALLRFGNPIAAKERVTGSDVALSLDSIWADLRFAFRQLRKNPGFALTAIAVLALGICASVAIFAFVDAVLITPLPYTQPNRLMALFESNPLGPRFHLSYLDYLDYKNRNKSFQSLELYDSNTFAMNTTSGLQRVDGMDISAGFLRTLGITPILGRDFHPGEDQLGAPRVALLSYAAWQNRYGARPDALGQSVTLNGETYTLVGVLPAGFHFAAAGPAEFWTAVQPSPKPENRGAHYLAAIGRLKDEVTLSATAADMSVIAAQLAKDFPDSDDGRGATVVPWTEVVTGNLRPILLLLMSGAILLLLIATVNTSSLLLVRSENRRREIALRGALGATRGRLTRQFITEGLTLAAISSVLGLAGAYAAIRVLTKLVPAGMIGDMPYLKGLGLNPHTIGFALLIAALAALQFSMTPFLRLSLSDVRSSLNGSRSEANSSAGAVWRHLGSNLVVLELAIAMVLLSGAGLLGRSFYRLMRVDVGMQTDHIAMIRLRAPSTPAYANNNQIVALSHRVLDAVRHLPGVESAAVAHQVPLANVAGGSSTFEIVGQPAHGPSNEANARQVSADYFSTIRARLLRGRFFTEADDATKPRVLIVNQSFARKYFPGQDPIGKQIRYDDVRNPAQIVGVLDNIKEGPMDAEVAPAFYTPYDQAPDGLFNVIVRTAEAPQSMLGTLETTLRNVEPGFLVYSGETMEDRINLSQSAYLHRSSAWLVGGFAIMALLLGVVGLYGVIAYSVSQRTREIGVRMALGAQRGSVYRLVMTEAGRLIALGIAAGLLCSIAAAALMRSLLFGTAPWDAPTLIAVAAILTVSAALASYIPARRAASVNPMEALRAE